MHLNTVHLAYFAEFLNCLNVQIQLLNKESLMMFIKLKEKSTNLIKQIAKMLLSSDLAPSSKKTINKIRNSTFSEKLFILVSLFYFYEYRHFSPIYFSPKIDYLKK